MYSSVLITPIGRLVIQATDTEVFSIGFNDDVKENGNGISESARQQLSEYFEGRRSVFNFKFSQSGSNFQQQVWNELVHVKAGNPISYTSLSKKMNSPLAIRAIASANGKNKLMIVVPCHRIIGSNGDLVGFSAGLWRKKWLLEHEAAMMKVGQSTLFR